MAIQGNGHSGTAPNRRVLIVLLGGLSEIAPFSIDTYLPAFGAIATGLGTTVPRVGLSLSSYFFGICLGQLAYGPILDRFGRKTPLLWGMGTLIVASLGCALAPSVEALIVWRFLQAVSGCVGMVASRALVMDFFPLEANRVFSSLMLVMGVAPILAPSVGGWLATHFGWRSIFYFQTLFAAGLMLASFRLLRPDGRHDRSFSLHPCKVLAGYGAILRERTFLAYSTAGNMGTAGLLAYIAGSPFVYMKLFGLTAAQFGWVFGLNSVALILGSQINILLIKRLSPHGITRGAMGGQLLVAAGLALGAGWLGLGSLPAMGLVGLYLFTQGLVAPNAAALSMQPFRHQAGSASALSGALQMGFSAIASGLVAGFHDGSIRPMALIMMLCSGLGFLALWVAPGLRPRS